MSNKKASFPIESTELEGIGTVSSGKLVSHAIFGNGEIKEIAKWETGEITVNVVFDKCGSKWLVPEFAKLKEQQPTQTSKHKVSILKRLFGRNDT
jgi:hypothetical protein